MKHTIILMVINTLFNDMIVPSIIIPDFAPDLEFSVWSIKSSASIFMFH